MQKLVHPQRKGVLVMNLSFHTKQKTYHRLAKLPLGSVTAQGWLKEQLLRNKAGMGGNLDKLEPAMIANPFIDYSAFTSLPFMEGPVDPTFAAGWSGEISGTYWTGLVELAFTLNDEELKTKAENWVEGVLRHQEPDGYLGSYPETTNRMADYNPWASTWCYRALLAYFDATGRQDVLNAVYRGLLWFCENWKNHKTDYTGNIIIEPMSVLYAHTGDERLLNFCRDWVAWLEENAVWQNKFSQYLSAELPYNSMHAVAYGECVKNPLTLYCVDGKELDKQAGLNGLQKALDRIVLNTGSPSSCTEFLSPKGASAETEYCNFATYSYSYAWAAMTTGDPKWGDEIERTIFNGAQGARKKDERAIAYFSAPNQLYANRESSLYGQLAEYGVYAPCYNVACCPCQSVRILPEFIRSSVMINRDGELYFYLYAPASVKTPGVELDIDTAYPFRDRIIFRIQTGKLKAPHFRVPAWCKTAVLYKNGQIANTVLEEGFLVLKDCATAQDVLELILPQEVVIQKIDDSDMACKYPISITRGPLVYALPVPAQWSAYAGNPITPLPEDWNWFEAQPDMHDFNASYFSAPWQKAIDEDITPDRIRVREVENDGYVWEQPPVMLEVPLLHAKYAYVFDTPRTHEFFGSEMEVTGEEEYLTLVPYGCTNLRITYLPRAKKNRI